MPSEEELDRISMVREALQLAGKSQDIEGMAEILKDLSSLEVVMVISNCIGYINALEEKLVNP